MQYKILVEISTEKLEKAVQEAIADGWQLQGGVSITQAHASYYEYQVIQAIIKP